jgi:hypothetical protein
LNCISETNNRTENKASEENTTNDHSVMDELTLPIIAIQNAVKDEQANAIVISYKDTIANHSNNTIPNNSNIDRSKTNSNHNMNNKNDNKMIISENLILRAEKIIGSISSQVSVFPLYFLSTFVSFLSS